MGRNKSSAHRLLISLLFTSQAICHSTLRESRGTSQKNNLFKKCLIISVTLWSIKRKKPKFKIL